MKTDNCDENCHCDKIYIFQIQLSHLSLSEDNHSSNIFTMKDINLYWKKINNMMKIPNWKKPVFAEENLVRTDIWINRMNE